VCAFRRDVWFARFVVWFQVVGMLVARAVAPGAGIRSGWCCRGWRCRCWCGGVVDRDKWHGLIGRIIWRSRLGEGPVDGDLEARMSVLGPHVFDGVPLVRSAAAAEVPLLAMLQICRRCGRVWDMRRQRISAGIQGR
jgi:hypothetical protein